MKKLNRVIIKEELVAITKDPVSAAILNQFLYWQERRDDYDQFLEEEKERLRKFTKDGTPERLDKLKSSGWIYKTCEELSTELLGIASRRQINRKVISLVKSRFLLQRNNPEYKWDRTLQYMVNLKGVAKHLLRCGYTLEGYPLVSEWVRAYEDQCNGHTGQDDGLTDQSNGQGGQAIPKTTSETSSEKEEDPPTPHRGNGKVGSFRSSVIANLFTTQFWPIYPRKESKGRAIKAFNAINPTAELVARMVVALTYQKGTDKWLKDNGQYIPLPATWLNDMGWENEMRVEDAPGYDSVDDPDSPDYDGCGDNWDAFNPLTGKDEFHTITEWRKMGFKESGFWIDEENRRRTDDAPYNHRR